MRVAVLTGCSSSSFSGAEGELYFALIVSSRQYISGGSYPFCLTISSRAALHLGRSGASSPGLTGGSTTANLFLARNRRARSASGGSLLLIHCWIWYRTVNSSIA